MLSGKSFFVNYKGQLDKMHFSPNNLFQLLTIILKQGQSSAPVPEALSILSTQGAQDSVMGCFLHMSLHGPRRLL